MCPWQYPGRDSVFILWLILLPLVGYGRMKFFLYELVESDCPPILGTIKMAVNNKYYQNFDENSSTITLT